MAFNFLRSEVAAHEIGYSVELVWLWELRQFITLGAVFFQDKFVPPFEAVQTPVTFLESCEWSCVWLPLCRQNILFSRFWFSQYRAAFGIFIRLTFLYETLCVFITDPRSTERVNLNFIVMRRKLQSPILSEVGYSYFSTLDWILLECKLC